MYQKVISVIILPYIWSELSVVRVRDCEWGGGHELADPVAGHPVAACATRVEQHERRVAPQGQNAESA